MIRFTGLVFLCFALEAALCQVHLGPIGDPAADVTCYHCADHGHELFPGCLAHVHRCHGDEVCKIVYGDHKTEIHCQKANDCAHETANAARACTGGGVEARPNECQKCCSTDDCVNDLVDLMKLEATASDNLMCVGACDINHLEDCVAKAHQCGHDQYCQITQEHGRISGECHADHDFHHCSDELHKHDCTAQHHHPGRCFIDCCNTNDCMAKTFGAYMTTMAPATTMAPVNITVAAVASTTMDTNVAPSLWERLHGECKDQLAGDGCAQLMKTQDVCHDRLALSICPETCGLCSAINSTVCEDTVVNDGCKNLVQHEDVCNDSLSVFVCADTCKLCDELINSLITSLVNGDSTATDMPATLLPPSANPSAYPTFDCNDLADVDCGLLDGLCASSFMGVVCPNDCAKCAANSIKTQTAGLVVDLATTQQATMGPTSTMMKTMPPSTMKMTTMQMLMSTTKMPMPTTTMAMPTNAMTTNGTVVCADHLSGVNCADLANICGSVMAVSACPKYCGLC